MNYNFEKELKEARKTPEYKCCNMGTELAVSLEDMMITQNISKEELAKRVGCKVSHITGLLLGNNVSLLFISKIAVALGCDIVSPTFYYKDTLPT